jgi:DNA anti-recombination protein RmuC
MEHGPHGILRLADAGQCTRQARCIRFLGIGTANEKEAVMKIAILIITVVTAAALAAFGQERAVENVKHGAKKAGETVKDGLETAGKKTKEAAKTVGQKTKETAETVGHKTKETAQTVGRRTKETAETVGEKTKESAKTVHQKSKKALNKTKEEISGQQSTNQAPNTPSPTDR